MRRLALLLPALLLLAPEGIAAPPRGHLILVGGGGVPAAVRARALELCGAKTALVAILPQASGLRDRGADSVAPWLDAGAAEAINLDPLDAKAKAILLRADIVWMPGGSQERLMQALRDAGLVEVLHARHAAGAVIAGTSAGAAVGSERMLTGDADLEAIRPEATKLAPGLGLWPGVIVDQHFVRRRRNNRLLAAVLDHPTELGVGIDEATAVVVSAGGAEVIGEGSVLVYDARAAQVAAPEKGRPHGATALRLHVLRAGMRLPR